MSTIQILTRNNEKTVEETIDSLKDLDFDIIVGDLGSTDATLDICSKYNNVEIVNLPWEMDYSKARNKLIRDGINLYINPWEIISHGHEEIKKCDDATAFYVIRNKVISKETRLWKDSKFINPVYETLEKDNSTCNPSIVLISNKEQNDKDEKLELCKKWINSRPTDPEPYYYLGFSHLSNGEYKEFLRLAEQYLIMNKKMGTSQIMLNYQVAAIELRLGELKNAIKRIIICIFFHPTFAEFWCLLGDLLYKQGKYKNAKQIYENAITLGKRRLSDDFFPIEILKYSEYPQKMIRNIENLIKESSYIAKINNLEK